MTKSSFFEQISNQTRILIFLVNKLCMIRRYLLTWKCINDYLGFLLIVLTEFVSFSNRLPQISEHIIHPVNFEEILRHFTDQSFGLQHYGPNTSSKL